VLFVRSVIRQSAHGPLVGMSRRGGDLDRNLQDDVALDATRCWCGDGQDQHHSLAGPIQELR
jgi:hypothetical protein